MANTAMFLFVLAALSATARSRSMLDTAAVDAHAAPTATLKPGTNVTRGAARADPQCIYLSLWYGSYCGSGTTDFTKPKIDALDACCEKHDRCFDGNHRSCDMISCNQELS
jgi:hypothetical protein